MLLDHSLGGFAKSRLAAQRHTAHGPVLIFHSFLSSFFLSWPSDRWSAGLLLAKPQVGCTLILQLKMQTNLSWNVGMLNSLLKVRHKHQITCLKPTIVKCMVIDVAKHCSCADSIRSVTRVNEFAHFVKTFRAAFNFFFWTFLSFIRLLLGIW